MKISILTLRGEFNYGNLLQSFALQKVLKNLGADVEFVNRRKNYPTLELFAIRVISILKCIIRRYILFNRNIVIKSPFDEDYLIYKEDNIDTSNLKTFAQKYLNLSQKICSEKEMLSYAAKNDIDCYVVGSDQVWREEYTPSIEDYFLGFLPPSYKGKRIAYAASLGIYDKPISDEHLPNCIRLSKMFDAVSVREKGAIKYLNDTFGIKAEHVLDPTLLLDIESYTELITETNINKKIGLVSYILDETSDKKDIISDCARTLQISINPFFSKEKNKEGIVKYKSVSEWLSYFKYASFVITDSFHGCAFCIIFKKNFIVIGNAKRGMDRFNSLLGLLGLKNRLICTKEEYIKEKKSLLSDIDYNRVEKLLDDCRRKSIDFLKKEIS